MKQVIHTVEDLGALVRATRKDAGVRLDDLASTVGLSKQFVNDLELGKPGVQMGKVLQVLGELGLMVYVDAPDTAQQKLEHSRTMIRRTNTRRSERGGR
jgi:transcriptional regulator with XRE-family HTH domain